MKILGALLLIVLTIQLLYAGELPSPPPLKDEPVSEQHYLAKIHQQWNNDVVTTTNPNGDRLGKLGDRVVYNNAGSYKVCWNISSGGGTSWRCDASALTAP